jgi:putative holliday junction resolvase
MKILAIDYGRKRIGLARTDESGTFVFADKVVMAGSGAVQEVVARIRELEVKTVVMGLSLDNTGLENPIMKDARIFAHKLEEELQLTVHFQRESYTTQEARRQGQAHAGRAVARKQPLPARAVVDAAAAALILQAFIDSK